MRRIELGIKLVALPLALALATSVASAQNPIGSATVTGPVRVDGQAASGAIQVQNATRLSTGDNANVTFTFAQGGVVGLAGQADVVVTRAAAGPYVQLVCGDVTVTTSTPTTVMNVNGGRVMAKEGRVTVTEGGKVTVIKKGKEKDFGGPITVAVDGAGSVAVVMSKIKCNCNCT